ncbi:hypothetical protein [Campylobacter sp. RM16188]|uniref:hypothetical protein n=1 Tax=Campylobacter sp. RM16188 TaxID=1705725 RepID=UPI001554DEB6|nr:hypothetical protein [Campylobacter sp. RM16188]
MKVSAIVMSIHRPSCDMLVSGQKSVIHRKRKFSKGFQKIYVYAPKPIAKIIGELEVGQILSSDRDSIWEATGENSCLSKGQFYKYYDSEIVYAVKIKKAVKYKESLDPKDIDPKFKAPVQFYYLNL